MATQNTPTPAVANAATQAAETADVVYLGNKRVRARYKVRPEANGPQYTVDTVFDYGKCTEEQIVLLANANVVIKTQARLRDQLAANPKLDLATFKTVDVLSDVVTASANRDPVAAAVLQARKAGVSEKVVEMVRQEALAAQAKAAAKK